MLMESYQRAKVASPAGAKLTGRVKGDCQWTVLNKVGSVPLLPVAGGVVKGDCKWPELINW